MSTYLGIDTGGTYTDAVLFDKEHGVLASAKALTTKYDLAVGIHAAIEVVLPHQDGASAGNSHPAISLVSISTTLATNALVEGHGTPICLLLLGYPANSLSLAGLGKPSGATRQSFCRAGTPSPAPSKPHWTWRLLNKPSASMPPTPRRLPSRAISACSTPPTS